MCILYTNYTTIQLGFCNIGQCLGYWEKGGLEREKFMTLSPWLQSFLLKSLWERNISCSKILLSLFHSLAQKLLILFHFFLNGNKFPTPNIALKVFHSLVSAFLSYLLLAMTISNNLPSERHWFCRALDVSCILMQWCILLLESSSNCFYLL